MQNIVIGATPADPGTRRCSSRPFRRNIYVGPRPAGRRRILAIIPKHAAGKDGPESRASRTEVLPARNSRTWSPAGSPRFAAAEEAEVTMADFEAGLKESRAS